VVVIEAMSRPEFALNFPRVYRGTHLAHPKVNEYTASEVHVELRHEASHDPAQRMFLEAEGELFGEAPATLRVVPDALRVIAP
jgi:diacylglycerol kinase (ATP)